MILVLILCFPMLSSVPAIIAVSRTLSNPNLVNACSTPTPSLQELIPPVYEHSAPRTDQQTYNANHKVETAQSVFRRRSSVDSVAMLALVQWAH